MLSVLLMLLIAAQPVQAGFCDMKPSNGAPQQIGAQHAGMQHGSMQTGAQAEGEQDAAGHDCCAAADPEASTECDTMDQCGFCTVGTAAVPALDTPFAAPTFDYRAMMGADQITPSHALPPFRPPTTVS